MPLKAHLITLLVSVNSFFCIRILFSVPRFLLFEKEKNEINFQLLFVVSFFILKNKQHFVTVSVTRACFVLSNCKFLFFQGTQILT